MEPNDSNDERQPRNIRNQPFAWQDKKTLTMIAEIFDATNDVNSARSVYVALTEFASDNGCETFTVPINQIARRSGVSYRTASGILNRFESLRLIAVQRHIVEGTKERAPSTFTMLGNRCLTLSSGRNQSLLPKGRKEREKKKKESASVPANTDGATLRAGNRNGTQADAKTERIAAAKKRYLERLTASQARFDAERGITKRNWTASP